MTDPFKMIDKSCSVCVFYDAYNGLCRRNAPRPTDAGRQFWPVVEKDDWCGEWQLDPVCM